MDKENNIVAEKSKLFAIRIVNLYKYLLKEKKEYLLSKQLVRSGTSIGANIAEAICTISKKDFIAKMYIAYKECSESLYWIELLYATEYLDEKEYLSIWEQCKELHKILSSITKSSEERIETLSGK
ncbi:MAG: four helix bundle protein [Bacteroidaceae bacterium]|nr:four helix bundle protein [Bacteroidaceae bacterium]